MLDGLCESGLGFCSLTGRGGHGTNPRPDQEERLVRASRNGAEPRGPALRVSVREARLPPGAVKQKQLPISNLGAKWLSWQMRSSWKENQ